MDTERKKQELKELEEKVKTHEVKECEVYSRIVGYFRPKKQWNPGKQEEDSFRKYYDKSVRVIN